MINRHLGRFDFFPFFDLRFIFHVVHCELLFLFFLIYSVSCFSFSQGILSSFCTPYRGLLGKGWYYPSFDFKRLRRYFEVPSMLPFRSYMSLLNLFLRFSIISLLVFVIISPMQNRKGDRLTARDMARENNEEKTANIIDASLPIFCSFWSFPCKFASCEN